MSWRDAIAKRLMAQPRPHPLHPEVITGAQNKILQNAEQVFNRAQGDRGLAAQQQQQTLDWYRGLPDPQSVNPANTNRVEDTLRVLQSDEPLDEWWRGAQ
jgi:hypothetical protein